MTLNAPGQAYGAQAGRVPPTPGQFPGGPLVPPRAPLPAGSPPPSGGPGQGQAKASGSDGDEEEDDGALATMVMAGLDASDINDEVEAALAAKAAGGGPGRLPSPGGLPRPAAGAPAPFAPSGAPFSPLDAAGGHGDPRGLGAALGPGGGPGAPMFPPPEPTVDEPMHAAPFRPGGAAPAPTAPWQAAAPLPAGYPPAAGPGSGGPGYGQQPSYGGGAAGPAVGGGAPSASPFAQAQSMPWSGAGPAAAISGLPDNDELDALAAQDRRLKRMLGVAIVVLIIVLSAVVMLWLRRAGMVAF
jgi:hypothetical protein